VHCCAQHLRAHPCPASATGSSDPASVLGMASVLLTCLDLHQHQSSPLDSVAPPGPVVFAGIAIHWTRLYEHLLLSQWPTCKHRHAAVHPRHDFGMAMCELALQLDMQLDVPLSVLALMAFLLDYGCIYAANPHALPSCIRIISDFLMPLVTLCALPHRLRNV
jgi:hypothetical protein